MSPRRGRLSFRLAAAQRGGYVEDGAIEIVGRRKIIRDESAILPVLRRVERDVDLTGGMLACGAHCRERNRLREMEVGRLWDDDRIDDVGDRPLCHVTSSSGGLMSGHHGGPGGTRLPASSSHGSGSSGPRGASKP